MTAVNWNCCETPIFVERKFLDLSSEEVWQKRGNTVSPSGHYMYRQFNIQQFRSAHTVYLCVLCGSGNKQWLFPYTALTDWFL